jgi:hypothetical protein
MRINVIGTEQEIGAALEVLRAGLDGVVAGEPIGHGELVMVSIEAHAPLRWLSIDRDGPVDRAKARQILAELEPAATSPTQRRPRRTA